MKMMRAILTILSWAVLSIAWAQKQSDDVPLGNTIDEPNNGLPMYTKLNGTVYNLNEISPKISLNRTQAFLNCSQGTMYITLTFQEPFYGVAYADFDRNSACMTKGRGDNTAKLELPLKGCGTIQDPARVFTNNIIVRFHPGLEMDGDEVITIVCRYPTAKTGPLPNPFIAPPSPPVIQPNTSPPMSGMYIVLVICSLLFLALLLLGLGCSYMCLKRRPVRIIHRHPFGSGTGSEITKLSGSSLGNISVFEGFKIPRALLPQPTYGSEANLVIDHSDTLPSDYPSESHSEVEARASSSLYSETINEVETTAMSASRIMHSRHSAPIEPKFLKRAPPPPSPLPSESDASVALERNLTTILEREETTRMAESPSPRMTTFSYVPELHQPPSTPISRQQTPPVYSRILRKQAERETFTETLSAPRPPTATIHRPRSLTSLNTENTETRSLTEVTDSSHAKYRVASILAPTPPPPPPIAPSTVTHVTQEYREHIREAVEPLVEPVVASRRPEITTHEVDDVFLRTVTEKKTIEDIERHRRQITEYHARPQILPDSKWDVNVRSYPGGGLRPSPPDWENFSDVSSASNLTITNEPTTPKHEDDIDVNIEPTYTTRADIPRPSHRGYPDDNEPSGNNLYHLERVLEPQYANEFTEEERKKWREIITTESTLRTLLTEAIVKEDYELIRKDARYVNLFPPAKWDAIIRILSPNSGSTSSSSHGRSGQRYKRGKSLEFDNRSRRSSLPTLYEYESDGGSMRVGQEASRHVSGVHIGPGVGGRVRKLSSTTRGGSEADLRSMSEMTVRDFVRVERDDLTSLSSYEGESLVRSLSQPSLARSGSEFTEHWGMPSRNLPHWAVDDDPTTSAETTPRAARRADHMESSATYDSTHQGTSGGGYGRSTRYSESQSIQVTKNQRGNWFHDDSEPEMQI